MSVIDGRNRADLIPNFQNRRDLTLLQVRQKAPTVLNDGGKLTVSRRTSAYLSLSSVSLLASRRSSYMALLVFPGPFSVDLALIAMLTAIDDWRTRGDGMGLGCS